MKKILFAAALVVGLCLSTAVANGASYTETESITFGGKTGYANLTVEDKVRFQFDNLQPGEQLAVSWWIRNDSSKPCPLEVKVSVGVTGEGGVVSWLDVDFYPGSTLQMGPGWQRNVALTVRMYPSAPNWTANQRFWVTVTFNSTVKGDRNESPSYHTF